MTLTDPFAAAPTEPEETAPIPSVAAISKEQARIDMGYSSESKVVLTFKEGTGYDASWIVLHANSVEEADAVLDQKFADLMGKAKKVAAHFRGGGIQGQAQNYNTTVAAPNPQAPPPGATSAPGGDARQCQHGAMQFKSGVSAKNGKVWKAFFCPTPKGTPGQCEAEFLHD